MLGKLLRQDMKTMSRFALPMFIASGVVSVVCCAMLYFTLSFAEEADTLWAAMIVVGGFYAMGLIAIIAMAAIVSVMTAVRYYKSLFTDEGYLNMVLPVKTSSLFNAKILNTVIWSALSILVASVCCVISVIVPTLIYNKEVLDSFFSDLNMIITFFAALGEVTPLVSALSWVNTFLSLLKSVLVIITAITVGSVIMKKHRVLGSILFYFLINFIESNLLGVFKFIVSIGLSVFGDGGLATIIFNLVINAAVIVGMYFMSYYILSKKFNIE